MSALSEAEREDLLAEQRRLVAMVAHSEAPQTGHGGLAVYRKLVRFTMHEAIANELALSRALLAEHFDRYVERFCNEALPQSAILRDVAFEFAVWATPCWQRDPELPQGAADLARYELLCFDVLSAASLPPAGEISEGEIPEGEIPEGEIDDAPLDADRPVRFHPSARVAKFGHAVDEWPVDECAADECAADECATDECAADESNGRPAGLRRELRGLFAYRDSDNEFRQLTLSPLATTILARLLLQGDALAAAIRTACREHGQAPDQAVIDGAAHVLSDLAERGALLGPGGESLPDWACSPWRHWLYDCGQQG